MIQFPQKNIENYLRLIKWLKIQQNYLKKLSSGIRAGQGEGVQGVKLHRVQIFSSLLMGTV